MTFIINGNVDPIKFKKNIFQWVIFKKPSGLCSPASISSEIAVAFQGTAQKESPYRRLHRFFKHVKFIRIQESKSLFNVGSYPVLVKC
jgi:hypothetical protein